MNGRLKSGLIRIMAGIVAVEAILQLVSFVRYRLAVRDSAMTLKKYLGSHWYFRNPQFSWWNSEKSAIVFLPHPVLTWTTKPASTPHIHIADDHSRNTAGNPANGDGSESIFMFGGSTTFGVYLPDDATIPSGLAKRLNADGHPATVHNYGQIAYNSNQEVLYLWLLLKEGKRPDTVILYDGCNDLYSYPHSTIDEELVKDEIGTVRLRQPEKAVNRSLVNRALVQRTLSAVTRYIKLIDYPLKTFRLLSGRNTPESAIGTKDMTAYPQGIADNYRKNIMLLDLLAKAYRFRYFLFWQPLIYDKPLTADEKIIPVPEEFRPVFQKTASLLETAGIPDFHNLSGLFHDDTGNEFVDVCHISASANAIVAGKIADTIEKSNR